MRIQIVLSEAMQGNGERLEAGAVLLTGEAGPNLRAVDIDKALRLRIAGAMQAAPTQRAGRKSTEPEADESISEV